MKIAVPYQDGKVFPHFGHSEFFKLYQIEDEKIKNSVVLHSDDVGHTVLAGLLTALAVDVVLCGHIGSEAKDSLASIGVKIYPGVSGDADQQVTDFLAGKLVFDPNAGCDSEHHTHHHDHEHGCSCGCCH